MNYLLELAEAALLQMQTIHVFMLITTLHGIIEKFNLN